MLLWTLKNEIICITIVTKYFLLQRKHDHRESHQQCQVNAANKILTISQN